MNPVLVLLILIGAVLLWFFFSFLFRGLGAIATKVVDDTKDVIFEDENNEEEKSGNEEN